MSDPLPYTSTHRSLTLAPQVSCSTCRGTHARVAHPWHRYDKTAATWERTYQGDYRLPPGRMPMASPTLRSSLGDRVRSLGQYFGPSSESDAEAERRRLANELADAVASQASFVGRILALGPSIVNEAWIHRAVTRYAQFLELAKAHPNETLVPTLDVDLIWHVHMLSPLDYRDDCQSMLGKLLSHDDRMEDTQLATAFEETQEKVARGPRLAVRVDSATPQHPYLGRLLLGVRIVRLGGGDLPRGAAALGEGGAANHPDIWRRSWLVHRRRRSRRERGRKWCRRHAGARGLGGGRHTPRRHLLVSGRRRGVGRGAAGGPLGRPLIVE